MRFSHPVWLTASHYWGRNIKRRFGLPHTFLPHCVGIISGLPLVSLGHTGYKEWFPRLSKYIRVNQGKTEERQAFPNIKSGPDALLFKITGLVSATIRLVT